jgi:predicted fused transcriptional regulator/phosphomethylpyrimidine kinase
MHQGRLVAHLVVIIVVIIARLVFLIIVLILHVITEVLSCLGVVDGLAAGAAATLDDVAGVNGLEVILSIILLIWKDTKLVSGRVIGGRAHVASKHSTVVGLETRIKSACRIRGCRCSKHTISFSLSEELSSSMLMS